MTPKEYETLTRSQAKPTVLTGSDLANQEDRTLLYGYTCERDTWHVYLQDGVIYTVVYCYNGEPKEVSITCNGDYIPDKRLYPARCDYEFCRLLREDCWGLPFTTFEDASLEGTYYGEVL